MVETSFRYTRSFSFSFSVPDVFFLSDPHRIGRVATPRAALRPAPWATLSGLVNASGFVEYAPFPAGVSFMSDAHFHPFSQRVLTLCAIFREAPLGLRKLDQCEMRNAKCSCVVCRDLGPRLRVVASEPSAAQGVAQPPLTRVTAGLPRLGPRQGGAYARVGSCYAVLLDRKLL